MGQVIRRWKEGGDARAGLQAAGGALISGLSGGAFGAGAGAAGAGFSSKFVEETKAAAQAVTDATGSSLIGNVSGNILSGLAGGMIGGSAGAPMASNVNLYNQGHDRNETEAEKEAQELHHQLEAERAKLGQVFVPTEGDGAVTGAGIGWGGYIGQWQCPRRCCIAEYPDRNER